MVGEGTRVYTGLLSTFRLIFIGLMVYVVALNTKGPLCFAFVNRHLCLDMSIC